MTPKSPLPWCTEGHRGSLLGQQGRPPNCLCRRVNVQHAFLRLLGGRPESPLLAPSSSDQPRPARQ